MPAEIEFPLAGSTVGYLFIAGGEYTQAMAEPPKPVAAAVPAKIRCKVDIPTVGTFSLISSDWDIPAAGPFLWTVSFLAPTGAFYANRTIKVYIVDNTGAEQPMPDDTVTNVNVGIQTPGDPTPGGQLNALPP